MNSTSNYLSLLLLSAASILVAAIVLAIIPGTCNDLLIGKRCWLHLSTLFLGGSLFFTSILYRKTIPFCFSLTDALLLLLVISNGIIYNWNLHTDPDKFALSLQLLFLWFMLRIGLSMFPELSIFMTAILLCIGSVEALLGITQFFHLAAEEHFLSRLTGSFINSDSYGGYLALLLPISLCWVLRYGSCSKTGCLNIRTLLFYVALPALILIMIILPSVINFTTWLATILPCIWIAGRYFSGGKLMKKKKLRHSIVFTYATLFIIAAVFVAFSGLCISHAFERNIRLFEYQPTFSLHPQDALAGTELPALTTITADPPLPYRLTEINVFILCLFIGALSSCFYSAYKKGMTDICGALLAAMIYATFSFPLIRTPFLVTLTFIAAIGALRPRLQKPVRIRNSGKLYSIRAARWRPESVCLGKNGIILLAIVLLTGSHMLFFQQKEAYAHYKKWIEERNKIQYEWTLPVRRAQSTPPAHTYSGPGTRKEIK